MNSVHGQNNIYKYTICTNWSASS